MIKTMFSKVNNSNVNKLKERHWKLDVYLYIKNDVIEMSYSENHFKM